MFKDAFQKIHEVTMCDKEFADRRTNHIAETLDISEVDAFIVGEALSKAIHGSMLAIGSAIDNLSPRLGSKALPLLLDRVPAEMSILNQMVVFMVLGAESPTPGCTCASCKQKEILSEELSAFELRIGESLRHG